MNVGLERIILCERYDNCFPSQVYDASGVLWGLQNLTELDFGDMSRVPAFTFHNMPKIRELTFNAAMKTIEEVCFQDIENLQKITLKQRDKRFWISYSSFKNTPTLTDVYVENETPFGFSFVSDENGFYPPRYTLHVPVGSKALYEEAPGWCEFGKIVEDVAGVDETVVETPTWRCTAVSGGVAIVGAEGMELRIVAIDGKLVERLTPTSDCATVHLPAGLYIVSAAGRSVKVCVR